MTQIQQTNIEIRRETILAKLLQNTDHEDIAKQLGISRSTVERDIDYLLKDENQLRFYKEQWLIRYGARIAKDPTDPEAFRALTQLIKRSGDLNLTQNVTEIQISWSDVPVRVVDVDAEQVKPDIESSDRTRQDSDRIPRDGT